MEHPNMTEPQNERKYRRSPYLVLLWSENGLELLHADTRRRFRIHPNLIAFLSLMGDWSSAQELAAETGRPVEDCALSALWSMGILQTDDEAIAADSHFAWDPLELAIQRGTSLAGCWPEHSVSTPPPEIRKQVPGASAIMLPSPTQLLDQPFSSVLERRRTKRIYAPRPLRLEELSALLHHSARIVRVVPDSKMGDRVLRPFPTAGARSELEIYVVSNDVVGLDPGAHYYDAYDHHLVKIRDRDDHQERLIQCVHAATGGSLTRDPAVILLITAVFARVMWKYRNLALTLIYKNTGCLFQTLYLVATALGLAPCAIGSGEEAANSRWLGLDPLRESQVGCFLIGTSKTEVEVEA
jgi:SagB-type dehydrogenase family enzyme